MKSLAWLLGILFGVIAVLAAFIGHRDRPAAVPQPAPTVTATVTATSTATVTATATETEHATAVLPSVCAEAVRRTMLMLDHLGKADDAANQLYDVLGDMKVDSVVDAKQLSVDQEKLSRLTDKMENGIITAEEIKQDIDAELYLCHQHGG